MMQLFFQEKMYLCCFVAILHALKTLIHSNMIISPIFHAGKEEMWTSQYKVHVTPDTAHKTAFDGVDTSLPAHQGQPSHVSLN